MMRVTVTGTPDFRFTATSADGHEVAIGASKSIGGDETGFRPMQLLLTSLGSCSGIDVVNILKKSRVEFTSVDVEVAGERKDGVPSPFTSIVMNFRIHGADVDLAKAEKAVSLSVEKYCSVAASLSPGISVTTTTKVVP